MTTDVSVETHAGQDDSEPRVGTELVEPRIHTDPAQCRLALGVGVFELVARRVNLPDLCKKIIESEEILGG